MLKRFLLGWLHDEKILYLCIINKVNTMREFDNEIVNDALEEQYH